VAAGPPLGCGTCQDVRVAVARCTHYGPSHRRASHGMPRGNSSRLSGLCIRNRNASSQRSVPIWFAPAPPWPLVSDHPAAIGRALAKKVSALSRRLAVALRCMPQRVMLSCVQEGAHPRYQFVPISATDLQKPACGTGSPAFPPSGCRASGLVPGLEGRSASF